MHSTFLRASFPLVKSTTPQHSISPYYRGESACFPSRIMVTGVRFVDFDVRSAGTLRPIERLIRMTQKRMAVSSRFGVGVLHWQAIV